MAFITFPVMGWRHRSGNNNGDRSSRGVTLCVTHVRILIMNWMHRVHKMPCTGIFLLFALFFEELTNNGITVKNRNPLNLIKVLREVWFRVVICVYISIAYPIIFFWFAFIYIIFNNINPVLTRLNKYFKTKHFNVIYSLYIHIYLKFFDKKTQEGFNDIFCDFMRVLGLQFLFKKNYKLKSAQIVLWENELKLTKI